jgi:hypothetical protein
MSPATTASTNVKQAVPFFGVTNLEFSLRFYADGLGFKMKHGRIPDHAADHADGRIRWCWLQLGDADHAAGVFAGTSAKGNAGNWSQYLFSVRRRAGTLSRIQIARDPDTETSICGKPFVGRARY